jgi:hypothetical protein
MASAVGQANHSQSLMPHISRTIGLFALVAALALLGVDAAAQSNTDLSAVPAAAADIVGRLESVLNARAASASAALIPFALKLLAGGYVLMLSWLILQWFFESKQLASLIGTFLNATLRFAMIAALLVPISGTSGYATATGIITGASNVVSKAVSGGNYSTASEAISSGGATLATNGWKSITQIQAHYLTATAASSTNPLMVIANGVLALPLAVAFLLTAVALIVAICYAIFNMAKAVLYGVVMLALGTAVGPFFVALLFMPLTAGIGMHWFQFMLVASFVKVVVGFIMGVIGELSNVLVPAISNSGPIDNFIYVLSSYAVIILAYVLVAWLLGTAIGITNALLPGNIGTPGNLGVATAALAAGAAAVGAATGAIKAITSGASAATKAAESGGGIDATKSVSGVGEGAGGGGAPPTNNAVSTNVPDAAKITGQPSVTSSLSAQAGGGAGATLSSSVRAADAASPPAQSAPASSGSRGGSGATPVSSVRAADPVSPGAQSAPASGGTPASGSALAGVSTTPPSSGGSGSGGANAGAPPTVGQAAAGVGQAIQNAAAAAKNLAQSTVSSPARSVGMAAASVARGLGRGAYSAAAAVPSIVRAGLGNSKGRGFSAGYQAASTAIPKLREALANRAEAKAAKAAEAAKNTSAPPESSAQGKTTAPSAAPTASPVSNSNSNAGGAGESSESESASASAPYQPTAASKPANSAQETFAQNAVNKAKTAAAKNGRGTSPPQDRRTAAQAAARFSAASPKAQERYAQRVNAGTDRGNAASQKAADPSRGGNERDARAPNAQQSDVPPALRAGQSQTAGASAPSAPLSSPSAPPTPPASPPPPSGGSSDAASPASSAPVSQPQSTAPPVAASPASSAPVSQPRSAAPPVASSPASSTPVSQRQSAAPPAPPAPPAAAAPSPPATSAPPEAPNQDSAR